MNDKKFNCLICNKLYSSSSSLSNHTRITHGVRKHNVEKKYQCRYCDKEYIFSQSRWKHEKTCKRKEIIEMEKIKEENERLLKEKMENVQSFVYLRTNDASNNNSNYYVGTNSINGNNNWLLLDIMDQPQRNQSASSPQYG
jgi:transcription elongation factor Elf1